MKLIDEWRNKQILQTPGIWCVRLPLAGIEDIAENIRPLNPTGYHHFGGDRGIPVPLPK
jgi:hypothetical protein